MIYLRPLSSRPLFAERLLLALAAVFVILSALALAVAPAIRVSQWPFQPAAQAGIGIWNLPALVRARVGHGIWASLAVWFSCAIFSHIFLNRLLPRHDPLLLPIALLLSGWGIALVWRLAPAFGLRQTLWLPVSLAGMFTVIRAPGDLRWLRRFKYTWLIAALALTALTLVFGVNPAGGGPRLWLGCCGLYFQPSEALKLLLVVYLAAYLAEKREFLAPLLFMWAFALVLLISQRDLGTGSLIFIVFLAMLYLASGQKRYLLAGLILLVVGGTVAYWRFDVVKLRVNAWINPWLDPDGRSFQIVQSLIALGAGGLFGRGPGLGAPTAIPVVHSDFVFAAITEEWGLFGAFAALALILVVVMRGLRAAALARGPFRSLLAAGLASLLGVQSFLIMGGVVKLIPLTGLTLPFLSYGGSSLLANFIIVGLLLRLSHDAG